MTILLSSGYWEHCQEPYWTLGSYYGEWFRDVRDVRRWRRRFSVLRRPAEWKHRLELVRPTWTLVVRFCERREWGFWTQDGFLDWRSYGKEWCD